MLKSVNADGAYCLKVYYCSTKLNTMQITIEWALPNAAKQHKFDLLLDKAKADKLKAYEGDAEMTDWLIMIWAKNHIRAAYQTGNADPILFNYQIVNQ